MSTPVEKPVNGAGSERGKNDSAAPHEINHLRSRVTITFSTHFSSPSFQPATSISTLTLNGHLTLYDLRP